MDRYPPGSIPRNTCDREASPGMGHRHRSARSWQDQGHSSHHGYDGINDAIGCDSISRCISLPNRVHLSVHSPPVAFSPMISEGFEEREAGPWKIYAARWV